MKSWKPKIERRASNRLPDDVIKFFHKILTAVENDDKVQLKGLNWKNLNSLSEEIHIYSDTRKKSIEIPPEIQFNTIWIKGYSYKGRDFIINLRHAFAHNYIECFQDVHNNDYVIRIALPFYGKDKLKLVCYLSLVALENIITALGNKVNNKTKKR